MQIVTFHQKQNERNHIKFGGLKSINVGYRAKSPMKQRHILLFDHGHYIKCMILCCLGT